MMRRAMGVAMLLAGALLLAGAVADSAIGDWLLGRPAPASSAPLTGVDRVFVRIDGGQVRIQVEDRQDLSVALQGPDSARGFVRLDRRGSELQVLVSRPWRYWPLPSREAALEVRLPASFAHSLGVQIRSGSLSLNGPSPDRPAQLRALDVELQSGRAELAYVHAEALTLVVRSGSLVADGVEAGQSELHQASGSSDLDRFAGPLDASLSSGSLAVGFASLTGPVTVNQASGRLVLDLPSDAGFELYVRMRSGPFRSDLPLAPASGDVRTGLRATHGGGPRVELRAASGSITLE